MYARTEVQRPVQAIARACAEDARAKSGSEETGEETAVAEQATPWAGARRGEETEARLSVDPLRATDRYRLVMPYSERV